MGLFGGSDPDKLMEKRDVRGLIKLLRTSDDPHVRSHAAQNLGRLGGPEAAAALTEALSDPGGDVTPVVVDALAAGHDVALAPLFETWLDAAPPTDCRRGAACALAQLEEHSTLPILARLQADADSGTRWWAAAGLGRLRDPVAVPA